MTKTSNVVYYKRAFPSRSSLSGTAMMTVDGRIAEMRRSNPRRSLGDSISSLTNHKDLRGFFTDGRGGVYGEFSVRVLRQPDVNEGFDEELDEIVSKKGRGEAVAGDAAYRW